MGKMEEEVRLSEQIIQKLEQRCKESSLSRKSLLRELEKKSKSGKPSAFNRQLVNFTKDIEVRSPEWTKKANSPYLVEMIRY